MTKVKVGSKGRHVTIPDGWYRVTEGRPHVGDKFIQCPDYDAWLLVLPEDCDMDADEFDCLIRKSSTSPDSN